MIFLDTSAIYALASRTDPNHARASALLEDIFASKQPLITHNYVLVESLALLHRRLGKKVAESFVEDMAWFDVKWVTADLHLEALRRWSASAGGASFVDHTSFAVMDALRLTTALAFDADFEAEGFALLGN